MTEDRTPLQRNLEILIAARGINPHSLAVAAGVEATTVKRILRPGPRSATARTLKPLADYLGVTVDRLLTEGAFDQLRDETGGDRPLGAASADDDWTGPAAQPGVITADLVEEAAANTLRWLGRKGEYDLTDDEADQIASAIAAHVLELSALPADERTPADPAQFSLLSRLLRLARRKAGRPAAAAG